MTIDFQLEKIQMDILKVAKDIQRVREIRLNATKTKSTKKTEALAETTRKINDFFEAQNDGK